MKKNNVALDARPLWADKPTGAALYFRYMLQSLFPLAPDWQFTLLHPFQSTIPFDWDKFDNVQAVRVPAWCGYWKRAWENLELAQHLRRCRYSLFHCPEYILPWFCSVPGVVNLHDISFSTHPEWMPPVRTLYTRVWAWRAASQARKVLTDSEYSKQEIMRVYHVEGDHVAVTPLAPCGQFHPDLQLRKETASRLNIRKPYFLHAGALHQRRCIRELVDDFKLFQSQSSRRYQLVLSGSNHYYPPQPVEQLIPEAFDGSGDVLYLGYTSSDDLLELYGGSFALVYPSIYEGFGLPALEGLACGLPVIVANATSIPEVVGDAALLINPQVPGEITQAMVRLDQDPGLVTELGKKGVARAGRFSWHSTAEQTLAVYQQIVGHAVSR